MILFGIIKIACTKLQGFLGILCNDIDHPTQGIRAIERRGSPLDNLYTFDIVQVDTIIVDIVKGLPCHTFAIHKEKHILSPEAHHIDIGHTSIIGKVDSREFIFQERLEVRSLSLLNLLSGNHLYCDRHIL